MSPEPPVLICRRFRAAELGGPERDAESGNDYATARYNVNRLGRFSSPDLLAGSVGDPQSLNRYSYVRSDAINFIDPLGLDDCLENSTDNCDIAGDPYAGGNPSGYWVWNWDPLKSIFNPLGEGSSGLNIGACVIAGNCSLQFVYTGGEPGTREPHDKVIKDRLQTLRDLLKNDPKCLDFLNSKGGNVEQELGLVIDHPETVGEALIPPTGNLILNAETAAVPNQAITINTVGAFFERSFRGHTLSTDRGRIEGGTEPAQLFILLHEFGHVMDVLLPDKDSQKLVDKNDKTLEEKCKELIASFPK